MARRSSGEGSIYQRADGKWCGALQVNGKRKVVYGKHRLDVVERLRTITSQASASGRLPHSGRLTLGEYLAQWLSQAEVRLRPGTLHSYRTLAKCHILPVLGSVKVSHLQALQLSSFYSDLFNKKVSPRRTQMVHRLLHKALGDAARLGLLSINPASLVESPKADVEEPNLWNHEQVTRFIESVRQGKAGHYSYLFGFLLASGCREGEALGLRWDDVDWERGVVRVERQITWVNNKPIEMLPKTKSSVRTLALPSWGMEMLASQKCQRDLLKVTCKDDATNDSRVFPTVNGSIPSPSNLRRALLSTCCELDLPAIRLHDLRHMHISLLAMNGVPVKVAQARAGHSSPTVTLRVYSHVIGDADRNAIASLESLSREL